MPATNPQVEPTPSPSKSSINLQQFAFQSTLTKYFTRSSSNISNIPSSAVKSRSPISTASPVKRSRDSFNTTTISPKKKKTRVSSGYAPPSKYDSQPNLLTDCLGPNLLVLFIGANPGIRTATTGHAYAHPSNLFWKLLHSSGCTPRRCSPTEDHDLPALYHLGNTNIVTRQTKDASELSREEMDAGVDVLAEKIRAWKPESVALVGKSIWEAVWRVRMGRKISKGEFRYGWQDKDWEGARVFVATTTSGLAAGMSRAEKEEIWKGLGDWVVRRREEREMERKLGNGTDGRGDEDKDVKGEIIKNEDGKKMVMLDAVEADASGNENGASELGTSTFNVKKEEAGGEH